MNEFLAALLVAIIIGLAVVYRWHRENKRNRRIHERWRIGNVPFGKWHERSKP